ncbi:MAG: hypothetical protein M1826_005059 [Phylliscum demangeonii]|nr:MAG: hypothetical protein M1826_005059 [Phylliscum demangeonii]
MASGTNWRRPWEDAWAESGAAAVTRTPPSVEGATATPSRQSKASFPSTTMAVVGPWSAVGSSPPEAESIAGRDAVSPLTPTGYTLSYEDVLQPPASKRPRLRYAAEERTTRPGQPFVVASVASGSIYGGPAQRSTPLHPPSLPDRMRISVKERSASWQNEAGPSGLIDSMSSPAGLPTLVEEIVMATKELFASLGRYPISASDACSPVPACDPDKSVVQSGLEWVLGRLRNGRRCVMQMQMANPLDPASMESPLSHIPMPLDRINHYERMQSEISDRPSQRIVTSPGSHHPRDGPSRIPTATASHPAALMSSPRSASQSVSGPLPSPLSLSFAGSTSNVLPPIASSSFIQPPPPPSALDAHIQDLQHQVSTRTLALHTLQREHDQLLAAFARSQARCGTLEKKSRVAESEINQLTEDRARLLSQIEGLEAQIEPLIKARDEARAQSAINGGQYMRIMSMASRLEAQNAADKKRWMAERHDWEQVRGEKNARIAQLEKANERDRATVALDRPPPVPGTMAGHRPDGRDDGHRPDGPSTANASSVHASDPLSTASPSAPTSLANPHSPSPSHWHSPPHLHPTAPAAASAPPTTTPASAYPSVPTPTDPPTVPDPAPPPPALTSASPPPAAETDDQDIIHSDSRTLLRVEITRLRQACHAMAMDLQDLKRESDRIEQLMQTFGHLGRRVVAKAHAASPFLQQQQQHQPRGDEAEVEMGSEGSAAAAAAAAVEDEDERRPA